MIFNLLQGRLHLIKIGDGEAVYGKDLIPCSNAHSFSSTTWVYCSHFKGKADGHKFTEGLLRIEGIDKSSRDLHFHLLTGTINGIVTVFTEQGRTTAEFRNALVRLPIDIKDLIAGLKTDRFPIFVGHDSIFNDLISREVGLSIGIHEGYKDDDTRDHVDDHSAQHDDQALPGWLGAKLPRLWFRGQLFGIHGLIYHAGNLYKAPKRDRTDGIFGFSPLKSCDFWRESDGEFFYAHAKKFGGKQVSQLM